MSSKENMRRTLTPALPGRISEKMGSTDIKSLTIAAGTH